MSKSALLLESLKSFFQDEQNSNILVDILVNKTGISLRRLETFITIQSKRENISYTKKDGTKITVHVAYKSSLVGYSKKYFDPFCRTERITFNGISTTVAQLNFIKWCITNGIIEYIKSLDVNKYPQKILNLNIHSDIRA